MRIVYVAGKSGGHIIPALTLSRAASDQGDTVAFIALDRSLDRSIIATAPQSAEKLFLNLATIYPRQWWNYPRYGIQFLRACITSFFVLRRWKPTMIISMGGYISIPVCLVARLLAIPLIVYELNAEPGMAVKLLARWAKEVRHPFASLKQYLPHAPLQPTSYPLRYQEADRYDVERARTQLGIPLTHKVLFILGGSQGSQQLNSLVTQALASIGAQKLYVIHQTGKAEEATLQAWYQQRGIRADVFSYRDDLISCYNAATAIITRGGSGALHEVAYFARRALIVPLEIASTHHQYRNAEEFTQRNPRLWAMARSNETEKIRQWIHTLLKE